MKRKRQEKFRLGVIFVAVIFVFTVITLRLGQIQLFLSSKYSKIVEKQSSGKIPIPASRGILYDRNGKVVANNIILNSLYSNPKDKSELYESARYIEKIFNLPHGIAEKKYNLSVNRFRWIKRQINDKLAAQIALEAPAGLSLREETLRDYPFGQIGKQVLGFTNIDLKGLSGFELAYDSVLAGKKGYADFRRDGLRNTYRVKEKAIVKPEAGRSMVMTIDFSLQEIVEEELKAGVVKYNAKSGMAVFINNNNGEILSAAYYDPDEKNPHKPVKLRPVTDQFEPGSIFKALTAAGIIEDGLVDFNDSIYCEGGKWRLGRRTLHDDKELEWLNFRQIMELSSNIGIGKYAIKQGGERLYESIQKFNIGQKLNIGWPGETGGQLFHPKNWSDYSIASLSMGHAVAVSPLQMANAMTAIANGGKLYRPSFIIGEVDNKGRIINKIKPELIAEIMSKATSDSLISFLRGVVVNGTAEPANSKIINIAGKTGTAQIPRTDGRGYYQSRFMASFAGFFPSEKPLVTGIIIIENPQPIHYGGWTAGPVFRKIAERFSVLNPDLFSVPDRQMAEKSDKFKNTIVIPDFTGRTYNQAMALAEKYNIKLRTGSTNPSGIVHWQYPGADCLAFKDDDILIAVKEENNKGFIMTDLSGLSIREVSAFLSLIGINYKVSGNGLVVNQSIKPGELIDENSECRLECQPI